MDRNATARLGSSASVLVCLRLGIREDRIRGILGSSANTTLIGEEPD